jgi:serine/threonine protein kinase
MNFHDRPTVFVVMEEAAVGSVLADRLVLQREIARGGMGVVFEARHQRLRTQVAVKLLTHETLGDIHVRERLFREAQALAMVGERGVVRVLDCAEDSRHGPYVVMEMLRGRPLDGILAARRTIGLADSVRVIDQVAQTLSEVHAHGVVHRDVKPSNLFIVREGRSDSVKLLDFGIALLPKSSPERVKITRSGAICGTPEYMSPEQLFARDVVDARSDVFSLAAVAYECLSGRIPFGSDLRDRAVMHSQGQGAPMLNVVNPAIPLTVARVIDKALSVDPNARFESAQLFAEALKGVAAVPEGSLQLLAPLATQAFAEHPKLRNTDVGVADPTELVIDLVQRRRSPRAPFLTPVRVLAGSSNEAFDGRSQDISERGMQVLLHSPLAVGTRVTLKFALPMTGTLIATSAVVRWCRNGRGASHAVGFEFDEAVESGADVIRRYVAWFGESEQA